MLIQKPKGTFDILPKEAGQRRHILEKIRKTLSNFNYSEIQTPTFENTSLFKRSIGEETDVVSKEMYSFNDDEFTLRPEMTAPVVRAYLENSMYNESPVQKLFYFSNMYRHERPQAGRYREFSQYGIEVIGSGDFTVDVEVIAVGLQILNDFGIRDIKTKINNIGTQQERALFIDDLKKYLTKYLKVLSIDSRKRFEKNPLRILDSKDPSDNEVLENAPVLYEYLSKETKDFFSNVLDLLKDLRIKFEVDYRLVRGFDYYTSTTFEVISDELGSQNAIFGGGRYDMLVEQLGGKPTPAIGFACGIERLMIVLDKNEYEYPEKEALKLFIVSIGEDAKKFVLKTAIALRKKNFKCETDMLNRSVKSQMKEANRLNAEYVIVIGNEELESNEAKLKRMSDGIEIDVSVDKIYELNYNID
ncbi:MAG: histidine--tRNA ligase [Ignavibacteria bacterium]|nr:histidine--tRNA ligase [Ignavibacteria bacterium]